MKLTKTSALVGLLGWATAGCVGQVTSSNPGSGGSGSSTATGGSNGTGTGGSKASGSGGNTSGGGSGGTTTGGSSGGSGGSITGSGSGGSGSGSGGDTALSCDAPSPGRSPLRRLTIFEYNNTVRDLLGDTRNPGNDFPSENLGNGFGNDADSQSVPSTLADAYGTVAADIAAHATADSAALTKLATCAGNVTTANEESCAKTFITAFLPKAYRRTVTSTEIDDYVSLYKSVRGLSTTFTFSSGVAAMIEAVLQAPDFLYRLEFGTTDPSNANVKKLTGRELATRLSYFFWQTMPDAQLSSDADGGMLSTREGVKTAATRLLNDQKSHAVVSFFFDNLLPLSILTGLERDKTLFPTFSAAVGASMRLEAERLIEYEMYENTAAAPGSPYAAGSWPALLTSPYTFVDQTLFKFYGASTFSGSPNVTGATFQKVNLNTSQRLGLLTLGGMMAGTTTTNLTNPVLRGSTIVQKLMCRTIPLPTGDILAMVKPPDPYSGKTARERYGQHSSMSVCHGCHVLMDPVGLTFENYDAVGLYRTTEHTVINNVAYDTAIDASGSLPGVDGTASNALDLVKLLASSEETQNCMATHWMEFGYGRLLDSTVDGCNKQNLQAAFKSSGYKLKDLLLNLTQTDGFMYRAAQ